MKFHRLTKTAGKAYAMQWAKKDQSNKADKPKTIIQLNIKIEDQAEQETDDKNNLKEEYNVIN